MLRTSWVNKDAGPTLLPASLFTEQPANSRRSGTPEAVMVQSAIWGNSKTHGDAQAVAEGVPGAAAGDAVDLAEIFGNAWVTAGVDLVEISGPFHDIAGHIEDA